MHAVYICVKRKREFSAMAQVIRFLLSNFVLTFLFLGLIVSAFKLLRAPKPLTGAVIVEALFSPFLLFSIGISFFYNFVMHVFFGDMAARFIGWQNSPFQAEVGFASLGFAVLGFMAYHGSYDLRKAAVIGSAIFQACAGIAHIRLIALTHDYAPGNAGIMLYMDFAIPLVGLVLLFLQHRYGPNARSPLARK
jgi:hypothetical protein